MAAALHRQGRFLTDDLDARRVAETYHIPISGTIGVLLLNVHQGSLGLAQGNQILDGMIRLGYRAPVKRLDELLS